MKKLFFMLMMVVGVTLCHAQAPNWIWGKLTGTSINLIGVKSTALDEANNVYTSGVYQPSAFFDSSSFTATNTASYLLKYNSDGVFQWVKSNGGNSINVVPGIITVDTHNNIIVSGKFEGNIITFDSDTLVNSGTWAPYLAKYDSLGNVIWAKTFNANAGISAATTDSFDNIYITGYYYGDTVVIGNDTLFNLPSMYNYFIAKLDASGNFLWARGAKGDYGISYGVDLKSDPNGNVYLTGLYSMINQTSQALIIGHDSLSTLGTYDDIFIAKYNSNGCAAWGRRIGNVSSDFTSSIAINHSGKIFVCGKYESPEMIVGTDSLHNAYSYNSCFPSSGYIMEFDTSGVAIWAKSSTGTPGILANCVSTDNNGNSYITAGTGHATGGSISFGSLQIPLVGNEPTAIFCFDSLGTTKWAKSLSEGGGMCAISVANNGDVFVGGNFLFHHLIIGTDTLSSNITALFGAKLSYFEGQGISELQTPNSAFTLYPNPTSGIITIESTSAKLTSIKIMNVLGECVYQSEIRNSKSEINLTGVSKGIYFLQANTAAGIVNKKIMVE